MNVRYPECPAAKAAFTLVELMVVIGLMALLGTVSVTGYFAAVRGMADRAAKEDTVALIRMAMQTCLVDQKPTAVLFYNRQAKAQSGDADADEAKASGAGSAIAIKMAGRISYVSGGGGNESIILDEFADWNQSNPVSSSASGNDEGFPFYRMADLSGQVQKGIDKCRSFVYTAVAPIDFGNEYMIAYGGQVQDFCRDYKKEGKDNKKFSGTSYFNGNNQRWGHKIKTANGVTWSAGDAYGVEIGKLDLPIGYIYGRTQPNSTQIDSAGALTFEPGDLAGMNTYVFNLKESISISAITGVKVRKVATITSNDLKDEAK